MKEIPFFKNEKELEQLIEFYRNDSQSLCCLYGSYGTAKSKLTNIFLEHIDEKPLVFKFECFEASTLDDMFLSIFNDLKKFYREKKISFAKIETNSLSKKINLYLSHITLPSILIIDSFENAESANREEIENFIEHITKLQHFKVLIISRRDEDLNDCVKIHLSPFKKDEISKYFNVLEINATDEEINRLYNITEGNTSYIAVSANIIKTLNTTLTSLFEEQELKKLSYPDYILQKLISFVPDKFKKSMYVLSLIKSGLPQDFLTDSGFFTREQLSYLTDKEVLSLENGYVFLKSYLKEYITKGISQFDKTKIHQYLKNLYESQLPLKPSQRFMPLSRTTMREQAAYHATFIKDMPSSGKPDLSYLGYINSNTTEWTMADLLKENKDDNISKKSSSKKGDYSPEKYSLTPDELALMGLPIDMDLSVNTSYADTSMHISEQTEHLSLELYLEIAEKSQEEHDYAKALDNYKKALECKSDIYYDGHLENIYKNCSLCSLKLNNTEDAIKSLETLYGLYYEKNDTQNANLTLLKIGQIHKEAYRFLKAKEIYERFINSKLPVSADILAHSYIGLAEIEEDSSQTQKAVTYYEKAFEFAGNISEPNLLSEAYFKYALILDDTERSNDALLFYIKSAELNPDLSTNHYLSAAYTNIAEIKNETGEFYEAYKNYRTALKYDSALMNNEGIYYLCGKLAQICEKVKPELVIKYRLKALSGAKRLQDKYYIINAYLETGDCYYKVKNDKKALKAFLLAKDILIETNYSKDDLMKIDIRINDLKVRLGSATFEKVIEGYKNNAV